MPLHRLHFHYWFAAIFLLTGGTYTLAADEKVSALIIDGRNNHDWVVTTDALRSILEHSGRFDVHVSTAPEEKIPRAPRDFNDESSKLKAAAAGLPFEALKAGFDAAVQPAREALTSEWENWRPDFSAHDVVVLNYNGPDWQQAMRDDFVNYVKNGGGLILVHGATNPFRNWPVFDEMIGLAWRPAPIGKALKIDPKTGNTFIDKEAGNSAHGSKHPFQLTVRAADHPIMRGLPKQWMHARDELYHDMRGPAKNLTVLSSAYSDPKVRGSGQHEPITWEVSYGKGRVIVTTMGHFWPGDTLMDSLYCVGFQTIFSRSCEYVATGDVSLPVPKNFPAANTESIAPPSRVAMSNGGIEMHVDLAAQLSATKKKQADPYAMLSPAEEHTTFQLATDDYVVELAAAEPDVQEPVLTVWDGNGAMYVAEMRSYMQDEKGTGTKTLKNGRIKRLEDTNDDGHYDRVTIFADNLHLPRAILPLDDRIAVSETDSMSVWSFRDTTGDGIGDEKTLLFDGKDLGNERSVEHQDSGLIWNLDNHIYISYNSERYRFTDGEWQTEKQRGHWTQWGLDHDDEGRLFWIHNSAPALALHLHPKYWSIVSRLSTKSIAGDPVDLGVPFDPSFMSVKSLCLLNDRGGEAAAVRAFTSACGQSLFRGHKLPLDTRGDHFSCDPTIHVVRRSKIGDRDGLIHLEKAESGDGEFLRSPDINCRFVNSATGPDGTLYVTDMYRGIIQDAPWLSEGPRKFIREVGLHDNNQHGRIWRVRHRDHAPGPRPRMLDETTAELVRHLQHPNGWWRDTAQKLIILRSDRDSVTPLLSAMAAYDQNALARLHALWTLEGIAAVDRNLVSLALQDHDPRVRRAAVQIAETLAADNADLLTDLRAKKEHEADADVAKQLIFSLALIDGESTETLEAIQTIARNHLADRGVMLATTIALWGAKDLPLIRDIESGAAFKNLKKGDPAVAATHWTTMLSNWNRGLTFADDMPEEHKRSIRGGEQTYFKSCVACHGADGKGTQVPGTELQLAPPLAGSQRVQGAPEHFVPILINGLLGPIDGKTYQAGFMAPAAALGITRDDRLAEVISYIRYAWGGELPPVDTETVKRIRQKHEARATPWTLEELGKIAE